METILILLLMGLSLFIVVKKQVDDRNRLLKLVSARVYKLQTQQVYIGEINAKIKVLEDKLDKVQSDTTAVKARVLMGGK